MIKLFYLTFLTPITFKTSFIRLVIRLGLAETVPIFKPYSGTTPS